MKNIFRKAVQKVRETAAKVSRVVKEHPEVAVLSVAAAVTGVVYAWAAYDSRKTVNRLNSYAIPLYDVKTVRDAVQNAYDAYKAGYEAEPEAEHINLVKYGFTRESAWMLADLGLCDGACDSQTGRLHMFYLTPDEKKKLQHTPFDVLAESDGGTIYNVETVLDAVQSAYDAVDEGHDVEPKVESVNIAKYGFTRAAAQVLGEIGLALGVCENHVGSVNMFHITDDDDNPMVHMHADWTEETDA